MTATIRETMLAYFDIDVLRMEPLGDAGRAWRVGTDGCDLVLRIYPPSRSADLLAADVATLRFLEGAAYRAPRLLRDILHGGLRGTPDVVCGRVVGVARRTPLRRPSLPRARMGTGDCDAELAAFRVH